MEPENCHWASINSIGSTSSQPAPPEPYLCSSPSSASPASSPHHSPHPLPSPTNASPNRTPNLSSLSRTDGRHHNRPPHNPLSARLPLRMSLQMERFLLSRLPLHPTHRPPSTPFPRPPLPHRLRLCLRNRLL